MTIGEKIREARTQAGLSQEELAKRAMITRRSVSSYENGTSIPKNSIMPHLARALGVTVQYLTDYRESDPDAGRHQEDLVEDVKEKFGPASAREMAELFERNRAFFAGGSIAQEYKDELFSMLQEAYVAAKLEAKKKYTPHSATAREK